MPIQIRYFSICNNDVKDELVEALSRESKIVDDISALTSGKDEFAKSKHESEPLIKCDDVDKKIDRLKDIDAKLHDEYEDH